MASTPESGHPYDLTVDAASLRVVIRREFDTGSLHQDWAHSIITAHPGPFDDVSLDLSSTGLLSSTFFAGLIKLHFHYTQHGVAKIRLIKPDPRMLRNLAMLRMDQLFAVTPR
jgi:anti-anti-sigma regulatory factor